MLRFPTAPNATADLVSLFREGLRQSQLRAGETAIVYADTLTNPNYPAAFLAAAKDLGAVTFQVVQPAIAVGTASGSARAKPSPLIGEAMRGADLVIDVSTGGMLYSLDQDAILAARTRILRVREPEDCLERRFPSAEVRDRSRRGGERLAAARRIRITSPEGTDLVMEKADRRIHLQYGMADEPGRWDHWPTGMVCTTPVEDTVEGMLVVGRASLIFPFERYVSEPMTLQFKNGVVTSIEGGADAVTLRDYLWSSDETNRRRLAHVGWGTDHRARWDVLSFRGADGGGGAEARSIYGGVLLALGENRDLGGQNASTVHCDIALRRARMELDGEAVVEDGRILDPAFA